MADSKVHLGLTLDLPADFEPEEAEEETAALGRVLADLRIGWVVKPADVGRRTIGRQRAADRHRCPHRDRVRDQGIAWHRAGRPRSWVSLSAGRSVVVEIDGDRLEVTGVTVQEMSRLHRSVHRTTRAKVRRVTRGPGGASRR